MLKNMDERQKNAWSHYMEGLQYKQISELTGISIHTLKSWQKKFAWDRNFTYTSQGKNTHDKVMDTSNMQENFQTVRGGLLDQLEKSGNSTPYYIDLVNDYMSMWSIQKRLIEDVNNRGIQIPYKNGERQFGTKKNDSVDSVVKYNSQMLNLLDKLGLKAIESKGDGDVEL